VAFEHVVVEGDSPAKICDIVAVSERDENEGQQFFIRFFPADAHGILFDDAGLLEPFDSLRTAGTDRCTAFDISDALWRAFSRRASRCFYPSRPWASPLNLFTNYTYSPFICK
jgi:hypothetical protein